MALPAIYVRGYEYSVAKVAPKLGFTLEEFPLVDAVEDFIKRVACDAYSRMELGYREGMPRVGDPVFIVVIDEDNNKEALEKRKLPRLHPDLEWAMGALDGPLISKPMY